MGSFQVRYDSRVIIYERKLFIRLATENTDNWMKDNNCTAVVTIKILQYASRAVNYEYKVCIGFFFDITSVNSRCTTL